MARPRKINDEKRTVILALVTAGCTRADCARYVNVDETTLWREAKRDQHFASQICKAEMDCKMHYIKNIMKASEKDWRAGAWFLERRYWQEYGRRSLPEQTPTKEPVPGLSENKAERLNELEDALEAIAKMGKFSKKDIDGVKEEWNKSIDSSSVIVSIFGVEETKGDILEELEDGQRVEDNG